MCSILELCNFAVVMVFHLKHNGRRLNLLMTVFALQMCIVVDAQRRIVVVDMESGVPVRNVVVVYGKNACDSTIWDGSAMLDTLADDFKSREIILRRSGYMTRTLTYEELDDTLDILPSFNALTEVIIYGDKNRSKFQWTLPKSYKPELPSPGAGASVSTDILGGIEKLFSYKRRKRLKEMRKRMAEY